MKKIFVIGLFILAGLVIISVIFYSIRQLQANAEIERESQVVPTELPAGLISTTKLQILPLYEEDRAGDDLVFGHGVSYLIRTDSSTILMDVGNNPDQSASLPFIQNMQILGVDLEEIDAIVISHPHPDHVGGTEAWQNKTISFGDFAADMRNIPIYAPIPMIYPGAIVIYSTEPMQVTPQIMTTGVISYPEVFPLSLLDNPIGHEQGLVINVAGEGLVLITGCGHPSLEKLVSRAEVLFGQPVIGVVGGLHYGDASLEEVQPHIQFLESRQPKLVALSPHDSSAQVIQAFETAYPDAYQFVKVGEVIQFP